MATRVGRGLLHLPRIIICGHLISVRLSLLPSDEQRSGGAYGGNKEGSGEHERHGECALRHAHALLRGRCQMHWAQLMQLRQIVRLQERLL